MKYTFDITRPFHFCWYCNQAILEGRVITLLPFCVTRYKARQEVYAHSKCWHKDLDNDSGSYTDRF